MKQDIDNSRDIRYKPKMMRLTISGPMYMYSNSISVIHNMMPESTFNKVAIQ